MEKEIDELLGVLKEKILKANIKHPSFFNSNHEAYGLLMEEVEEFFDEVKADRTNRSCLEAMDIAVVCIKHIYSARRRASV